MVDAFVHLHLHSEFSLADGIVRLKPLADSCAEFQQPAVALTDLSNLYGMVKFYRACLARGVKPIVGCDVWIENPTSGKSADRVTLLCGDNTGYQHLSKLLSDAYLRGSVNNRIVISWPELAGKNQGLLCLIDEHQGFVANLISQGWESELPEWANQYSGVFGDRVYFSVSRIGYTGEQDYISRVVELSTQCNIELVATNRVVFINREEFEAHEIRVCINNGRVLDDSRRPRDFTDQQYLKSTQEMIALFPDIPSAISNSIQIAKRCNLFLDFDQDHLPQYPDAGSRSEASLLLREYAEDGLAKRFNLPALYHPDGSCAIEQKYADRMNMELEVIENMGYPGYFLIVADFVKWARNNGIPVGPGRGSGAGSLVAWSTGITDLDPLFYGLLFERFLNPERVSLPDFDIDFCVDGRDRVIEYVAQRYGHDQVAQIITFGTMAAKAVVRDVGRVMGFPYGFVDQIAKLIPFEVGITLQKALKQEQMLRDRYDNQEDVQELIDAALQLEGIAKNVGKHAGGVVIAPKPLTEYAPLYSDAHLNQAITQLDKDDLESIGLIKFDFLGVRTLTILDAAVKMVNHRNSISDKDLLDLSQAPLDDPATFEFLRTGRTTAIFQIESRGARELIIRAHPEIFEDLVALVALYRPGPLQSGMVDDFVNRKAGREAVTYFHPVLESILKSTYGVIIYQEQVMEIARSMAGYTLGGADLLRKAMGKKLPEEMANQRETFVNGAVERGVGKKLADSIFTLMDKFAGYGFNRSHSVAYALIAYHSAWMKTHYPAAFMAAALSAEMDNTNRVVTLLADSKSLGMKILSPDINSSFHTFRAIDDNVISYGLGALKGIGRGVVENIVNERDRNAEYKSLQEFCRRLDMRKINKRVLEVLIKSGAMDVLCSNRASSMNEIDNAIKAAGQHQQDQKAGQFDMFGIREAPTKNEESAQIPDWTDEQRLAAEKETLGLYLTGHPYKRYAKELDSFSERDAPTQDFSSPRNGIFAGIMVSMRVSRTRRGKMAFVVLDNERHRVEVILFPEKFNQCFAILQKEKVLIAFGEFSADEVTGGCQMRVENICDLDVIRSQYLVRLDLNLSQQELTTDRIENLQSILGQYRGGNGGNPIAVRIHYTRCSGETGYLNLGNDWKVYSDQKLFIELANQLGADNISHHHDQHSLDKLLPGKPGYRQLANGQPF